MSRCRLTENLVDSHNNSFGFVALRTEDSWTQSELLSQDSDHQPSLNDHHRLFVMKRVFAVGEAQSIAKALKVPPSRVGLTLFGADGLLGCAEADTVKGQLSLVASVGNSSREEKRC